MNKSTCLVTGCAGFIGSHLTRSLLDAGYGVVGVDNFFTGYAHNMDGFIDHHRFKFYEASITEKGLLERLKNENPELDAIFQLAAIVSVPYSVEHAELTMEVNFEANARMIASAQRLGISTFVFAGSAAEYGEENRLPVREEYADEATQLSPYGVAKYKSSSLIEKGGFGCSLRFFNIFGPRQDPTSQYSGVISKFVDFGLAGKNMVIFGDGEQTRDFLYVSDVVTSYFIAAGFDKQGRGPLSGVYNVGTGNTTSVRELAVTVARLTAAPDKIIYKQERVGDIKHSCADVSKISASGFKAEISFEKGLEKTIEWAESQQ
ncbi:NAD-dependent epimerase/dehydratase family protein [Maridesulfovibrio hydrothermalis]|uniref:NAD-dependent epimerase/dehydratase n=1 Tax=Maridesulfovibrio hydrothermalis AM13 = DSM 14728 TaxID=1121451 RepID=L0RD34_9BACT|nr:NAD-dependent epimerase/dehydratase family protein [Maridesulfovibrio hydrothermalis]CCO24110.1 NAD-dependent epimerase/dehydratase [Maridesulfovibrio hydrothermalis AM13 = DSM 14728]